MLERFDENARMVFARAREEACALGREYVGTEHVLLGVCHQDSGESDAVLAPAGITTHSVRTWLAQHGDQGGGTPDGSLPFTPNVRFVLHQTYAEADGRQHQSIGPAHVLLALIRCAIVVPSDLVADLLRDYRVDLGALHARAAARANTDSAGEGFPFLGSDLAARACLPGRGRRWAWRAAVLAGYVPLATIAIILAPSATRVIDLAGTVIAPMALFLVMRTLEARRAGRRLASADLEPIDAPGLQAALAPAGLREIKVFCDPHGRFTKRSNGSAWRLGKAGMIFLRPALQKRHPDLTRFITAHEAAHLARDDSTSSTLATACFTTLTFVSATIGSAYVWLLFYIPAYALIVTLNWGKELACDRIAANAAGQIPARAFITHLSRGDARRRRLPFLPRIRAQLRSRFTHPTTRVRRNALARAIANTRRPALSPVIGASSTRRAAKPSPPSG
jgi:Zn-dependent protease with chaperone function